MKPKIIALAAIAAIIGLMALKLALNKKEIASKQTSDAGAGSMPVAVTIASAKILSAKISLAKTGSLIPEQEANIIASAQGKLEHTDFELGTKVKKGQALAQIDCKLKQLALAQTELTIGKLEKDKERFQVLLEGDAATEVQVNEIIFNYENAKIQAEQMRKQISDATIVAPISGVVVKKNFEEGEFLNPGMNLGTIVDVSNLKVRVQVSETEVYSVQKGQSAKVTSDVLANKIFTGQVNYVSPRGDETHNYLIEITLENDSANSLKAGTFVYVDFSTGEELNVLQIPRSALAESVKNPYVYVVENGAAKMRPIKVGRELGENIEVLEGLDENEIVVTTGQINLTDNAAVKVVE